METKVRIYKQINGFTDFTLEIHPVDKRSFQVPFVATDCTLKHFLNRKEKRIICPRCQTQLLNAYYVYVISCLQEQGFLPQDYQMMCCSCKKGYDILINYDR
jgi:uncharacterized protein with PIN domain